MRGRRQDLSVSTGWACWVEGHFFNTRVYLLVGRAASCSSSSTLVAVIASSCGCGVGRMIVFPVVEVAKATVAAGAAAGGGAAHSRIRSGIKVHDVSS